VGFAADGLDLCSPVAGAAGGGVLGGCTAVTAAVLTLRGGLFKKCDADMILTAPLLVRTRRNAAFVPLLATPWSSAPNPSNVTLSPSSL